MTGRAGLAVAGLLALAAAGAIRAQAPAASGPAPVDPALAADLDRLFDAPALARALMGVAVESLRDGAVLYRRNADKLVVPASNMKIVTMAAAASRLGWDFRYETRLEAAGTIADGTLTGDLVAVGSGDPSIGSQDEGHALVLLAWADAVAVAGIRRVHGRLIGDDNAFTDEPLGAGWAWDYLDAGYAAPSGALSYNENVVSVRIRPGAAPGEPARATLAPPSAVFALVNEVVTAAPDAAAFVTLVRDVEARRLMVRGRIPAGGSPVSRTTTVDNPTRYFVEGLRAALADRGITVSGGAWDIDDVADPPPADGRRVLARRESLPLSALAGFFMKPSQNFYGEMFLKTIGRAASGTGSAEQGRRAIRDTLGAWGVDPGAVVLYDGSGLSRYNYVTADALVAILKHVWRDERLRGPFLASLPVGGRDGTLASRMKDPALLGRVQAKTGTIANMRALSGYLTTGSGEPIVFSMIANHFTAPNAEIDALVEQALARLAAR